MIFNSHAIGVAVFFIYPAIFYLYECAGMI